MMTLNIWESEFKLDQNEDYDEDHKNSRPIESEKPIIDEHLLSRLPDYFAVLLQWRIELEQKE